MPETSSPTAGSRATLLPLLLIALAMVAGAAQYADLRLALTNPIAGSSLDVLMRGDGSTPFQYRVLVPGIARLFVDADTVTQGQLVSLVWWIEAIGCLGFVAIAWAWLRARGFEIQRAGALALLGIPLAAVHLVMPRLLPVHYVWDTPALAFTTALLLLADRRQWTAFLLLFPVATLNRETTVFLAFGLLVTSALRRDRSTLLSVVAPALIVWGAIKGLLFYAFRNNPGAGMFELRHTDQAQQATDLSHIGTNLEFLLGADGWAFVLSFGAGLWLPLLLARGLGDAFRAAGIGFLAYFGSTLFVGNVYESRLYGEYIGALLVGFAVAFGRPDATAPDIQSG